MLLTGAAALLFHLAVPADLQRASQEVPKRFQGQRVHFRYSGFSEKLIALTFDDGPDPRVTPRILATLRKHNARATFFVLGLYAALHPSLLRQIVTEGHAIGSHSYFHPRATTPVTAARELDWSSDVIHRAVGFRPKLFRPPYGITRGELGALALKRRYAVILWTIDPGDYNATEAKMLAQKAIKAAHPGGIALFHDGPEKRDPTAGATEIILERLSKEGYEFVTVTELLQRMDAHANVTPGVKRVPSTPWPF